MRRPRPSGTRRKGPERRAPSGRVEHRLPNHRGGGRGVPGGLPRCPRHGGHLRYDGRLQEVCQGEADIADASRAIKTEELEICRANGIEPVEIIVGFDGISLVPHPDNTFVDCLSTGELQRIWRPGSRVETWSDVRPGWPAEPIVLYGPGADSGTFDYFTDAIMGEEDASRPDFTASEDDNVLVQGVAGDRYALGYFGYAYYVENAERLKLLAVDDGQGCVRPSYTTIQTRAYSPLTRPLFIYIDQAALRRAEVKEFTRFYLSFAQ